MLTVEWSGHKTVLVEVPAGDERSNEVELSGFTSIRDDAGGYDRLADDANDNVYDPYARHMSGNSDRNGAGADRFVRPRIERGTSTPSGYGSGSASGYATPRDGDDESRGSASRSRSASTTATPASSSSSGAQRRSNNPFANPFSHEDDFAAADVGGYPVLSASRPSYSHAKSDSGSRRAPPALPSRPDFAWDHDPVQSPTGSSSTDSSSRGPARLEDNNPFR